MPALNGLSCGLPRHIILPILQAIRQDIAKIRDAVSTVHMRMVGGSLLIIYEADWTIVEEGLQFLTPHIDREDGGMTDNNVRYDNDDEDEDDEDDEDGDDGDNDDDNDDVKRPARPYTVKLIDFAHTRIKPGHGPDEGVLLGLDTVLKLVDGRIAQIRAQQ